MSTDSKNTIHRYLSSAQKALRRSCAKSVFWHALLIGLALADIFSLAALYVDFSPRYYLLLLVPGVAICLLKRPEKAAAACFLDRELQLEQGVISSYRLMATPCNRFSEAIIDAVAEQLIQANPDPEKLCDARRVKPIVKWAVLGAAFLVVALHFLPIFPAFENDSAKPNVSSAVGLAVEDIAQALQSSGERKLARQYAGAGRQWRRENVPKDKMLRNIEQMMRSARSRKREIEANARKFRRALSLPGAFFSGQSLKRKLAGFPRPLRNTLAKHLKLSRRKSIGQNLICALKTSRICESLRKLQKKNSRRAFALQRALSSLQKLSRSIKGVGGIESGKQPGEGIPFAAESHLWGSAKGVRDDYGSPLSFPKDRKRTPVKSYFKKNWWPSAYHPVVVKYFNAKNHSH